MDDGPGNDHSPTVVIARTVVPGRERELRRWIRRMGRAVERAPGFVDATFHEPNAAHPEELLIVYRFETQALLDAWLASSERQELIDETTTFMVGQPREQRLAVPDDDVVTLVSSVRLRPDQEPAYRELHVEAVAACRRFDGFVRSELLAPVPGLQDDMVTVLAFDTREHLQAWMDSDERRSILAEMVPLHEGPRTVNVVGGFAGWFRPAGARATKRWKQAVTVLSALFPISVVLTIARGRLAPDLPLAVGVLLNNVIGIVLLTWIVMPYLTRVLARWLAD